MTKEEYLFTCLAEECAEVIQVVGKILRFGASDLHPKTHNIPNIELLQQELNDVFAITELINDEVIELPLYFKDDSQVDLKIAKVKKYMDYSKQVGRLQEII